MPHLTRRRLLAGSAALGAAALIGSRIPVFGQPAAYRGILPPPAEPDAAGTTIRTAFTAAERPTILPAFEGHALPLWTFSEDTWLPVVRVPYGAALEATFTNALPREGEHTTIHWHGLRIPNAEDGVPYLVQAPVFPGDSYTYNFVPPDTGTFFFHTHCNTAEHLGRGLVGILIVDGDAAEPYDADEVILMRDWRVDPAAGTFNTFTTRRGAGRAGTYGSLRTVNGAVDPVIPLPAGADCRLRLLNVDPTRIIDLGIDGADAAIIAIDAIAIPPTPFDRWEMGPAMRIDIVIRTPADGGVVSLIDHRADPPLRLASIVATGPSRRSGPFDPAPLRAGRIPAPDLANAERREFVFADAADAYFAPDDPLRDLLGPLCTSNGFFWSINGTGWPDGGHATIPPPLAELTLGRSYRFAFQNDSQLLHPIHVHGYSFATVASNQRELLPHHGDTILIHPEETVEVAFVADNPGRWMIHCHIAEHQETGMMGYFTVS